jgi:hypothetical protein
MDEWETVVLAALIAALASLMSSWLTARITWRAAGSVRDEQARTELATALAAYGHALDRLELELNQLPPRPNRSTRLRSVPWSGCRRSIGRLVNSPAAR